MRRKLTFHSNRKNLSQNTSFSDMHSIEKLMLIHNLWFLNYGLVHVTRNLTFYQNKLLSKIQFYPDQLYIFLLIKTNLVENFTLIILSHRTLKKDLN